MGRAGVAAPEERVEGAALPDEEVVRRVLGGDVALFEVLMRRHNQRLYRAARAILRDDAEAEDVMQHAYVQAYAHLDSFQGRARFSTWLTKIAIYEAFARARRRRRDAAPEPLGESEEETMTKLRSAGPDPEQQALQGEIRVLLESAIEGLPAAYRVVLVMREVEGMTTSETAECLDISADAVKTRLHRAHALLREELFQRAGIATASAFSFGFARCDRVVAAVLERLVPLVPRQVH